MNNKFNTKIKMFVTLTVLICSFSLSAQPPQGGPGGTGGPPSNKCDVNLGPDVTICTGSTITLFAGNKNNSYLWSDSSTNNSLLVSASGTYWVEVSGKGGC